MTRRQMLQIATIGGAAVTFAQTPVPTFAVPKLPYAYDALEPYVDARTMEIHHDKHHQAYVDNLNKAVAGDPALARLTAEELLKRLDSLPAPIRTQVKNQGGGHVNHSLFWQTLCPASRSTPPKGKLGAAINQAFGTQSQLEEKLRAAAAGVFGSGWGWLSLDPDKRLVIEPTPNQDSPLLANHQPLLGIDVWEHAYYLKYQNRRADYLAAIMHVVNWDYVSQRYEDLTR
jgi:Fe-Mn family superoxide dismutase